MRRRRSYYDFDEQELAKDPIGRKLGGVCAGIARWLDVSTFFVRLVAVAALFVAPQVTLIAYGLAWFILDERA